jgi:hypothetical protein
VALLQQLDGGRQAGEAAADDGDAQLGRALFLFCCCLFLSCVLLLFCG